MKVLAKSGCIVPRQDHGGPPINDREPVDVPDTVYYRRRFADGSLIPACVSANKDTKKGDGK